MIQVELAQDLGDTPHPSLELDDCVKRRVHTVPCSLLPW